MKKLPKSIRTFIRKEKSRIRHQFFDVKKQEEAINKVYEALKISQVK